jgi:hypothetical protein
LRRVRRLLLRGLRARADLPIGDAKASTLGVGLRAHRLVDARGLRTAGAIVERFHLLDRLIGLFLSVQATGQGRAEETDEDCVANG